MTEIPQNRQSDGKYTFTTRPEADNVTLAPAPRRAELDGWPESVPEPEVTVDVGEGGTITTTVNVNGEPAFEVWNPADDIYDTESEAFVNGNIPDDVFDEAQAWAHGKHNEMSGPLRDEQKAAFDRAKAAILAKATGVAPAPASDEDLYEVINEGYTVANAARRDAEYATASILSRGILAEHPDAHAIGLYVSTADNGEYISGATVYNEAREQIGEYDEEDIHPAKDSGRPDRPFLENLGSLNPIAENAHWSAFNVTPVRDREDFYTIDLKKAASWAPGVEA